MNNYLYPFFWQHGETKEVLEEYMDRIYASGMKAVCIEARPHPDFVGKGWWNDLSIILNKAKENDMKIWILDDSHFPTGYANGKIASEYPQYKKLYINNRRFDFVGPMKGARINASNLIGRPWEKPSLGDKKILGVYLAKRVSEYTESAEKYDAVDAESIVELKDAYKDGIITLDVPKGSYSVFVVFTTGEGGEDGTRDYLNPLVKEATEVLVNEVYEQHYQHFGTEFGKTITAFFSDEPRFGNIRGTEAIIGTKMVLPWRDGMEKELPFEARFLPLLWNNSCGFEKEIRFDYMDYVTKLYSENFTGVLAKWCNEHGVQYLGHNIEDDGAHCRLGYGAGHYFRGQKDQDYAGIDVIGTQVVPGMPYHHDAFSTGGNNGEFYHYALGKLAASAAHLDPKKQGRAMCEAFGAYGWNEGLKLMSWITNHLISRGINTIVPHAFNPKAFPDWDCAPHFYAHGNNPQFRFFDYFTSYTNRLLELFNDGQTAAKTGVIYSGMIEWFNGTPVYLEKVLRELTEHQIDCDIISEDYFANAIIENGVCNINGVEFKHIIVPEAKIYPTVINDVITKLKAAGVKVTVVGQDVELCDLVATCAAEKEISLSSSFKELVYYRYKKSDRDAVIFFNENVTETADLAVKLPKFAWKNLYRYDAKIDKYFKVENADSIPVVIRPYETLVFVATDEELQCAGEYKVDRLEKLSVSTSHWHMSYADSFSYPNFELVQNSTELMPMSNIEGFENKAGTVAYESTFELENTGRRICLNLNNAYEIAEVFVNGEKAGTAIAPPYIFDITDYIKQGINDLKIEVTNTLGSQVKDGISQYLLIEPFGLVDNIDFYEVK